MKNDNSKDRIPNKAPPVLRVVDEALVLAISEEARREKAEREDRLLRATTRYQRARTYLLNDGDMQLAMHKNPQRAGEMLIHASTLLDVAGREYLLIAIQDRAKEAARKAKVKPNETK